MVLMIFAITGFAVGAVLAFRPVVIHPSHAFLPARCGLAVMVLCGAAAFPYFYFVRDRFWPGWGLSVALAALAWAFSARLVNALQQREQLTADERSQRQSEAGSLSDAIAKAVIFICGGVAVIAKLLNIA